MTPPTGDSGAATTTGDAPAGDDTGGATEPAEEENWETMDRAGRMEWMGTVVFPDMKTKFSAFDGENFGDFNCQTCHGDDMKEVDFKMPNAITPLAAADPVAAGKEIDEKVTEFMVNEVVPAMNAHLAPEQVTCFSCHLKDE